MRRCLVHEPIPSEGAGAGRAGMTAARPPWYSAFMMNEAEYAATDLVAEVEREVVADGGRRARGALRASLTALVAHRLGADPTYAAPAMTDSDACILESQGWPAPAIADLRARAKLN